MVNQTFKNLSEERREEILLVAFEEFALKGYQNASLSTIIRKVGVAKGSFYRYFSSKRDLFCYLLEVGVGRRYNNLDSIIEQQNMSFFDLIKLNFKALVQSDKKNPVVSGFMFQVMHERDNSEVSDVINNLYAGVIEKIKYILSIEQFNKHLNIIDADLTAYHIFYSQLLFYDFIAMKYNINFEENIQNHLPVLNLPNEEIDKVIDASVEILKNGLLKSKPNME